MVRLFAPSNPNPPNPLLRSCVSLLFSVALVVLFAQPTLAGDTSNGCTCTSTCAGGWCATSGSCGTCRYCNTCSCSWFVIYWSTCYNDCPSCGCNNNAYKDTCSTFMTITGTSGSSFPAGSSASVSIRSLGADGDSTTLYLMYTGGTTITYWTFNTNSATTSSNTFTVTLPTIDAMPHSANGAFGIVQQTGFYWKLYNYNTGTVQVCVVKRCVIVFTV